MRDFLSYRSPRDYTYNSRNDTYTTRELIDSFATSEDEYPRVQYYYSKNSPRDYYNSPRDYYESPRYYSQNTYTTVEEIDSVDTSRDTPRVQYYYSKNSPRDYYNSPRYHSRNSNRYYAQRAQRAQPKVQADHADLQGTCGTNFNMPVGDTFWCLDERLNANTHCVQVSTYEYQCCVNTNGCYDDDDMRSYSFY